jgi:hypothetical protein
MQVQTCYVKGVRIISLDIETMPTQKVNSLLGVSYLTTNNISDLACHVSKNGKCVALFEGGWKMCKRTTCSKNGN